MVQLRRKFNLCSIFERCSPITFEASVWQGVSATHTHTQTHMHTCSVLASNGIVWQDYRGKLSNRFPVIARTRKLNACSACQLSGN